MKTKIYVDPKFEHGVIACNSRTAEAVGKEHLGLKVILDEWIGDGLLACNETSFNSLQKAIVKPVKVPRLEDKVKEEPEDIEELKLTEGALYGLRKKDQVGILLAFGMKRKAIRKLRSEKDRVEAIIMLQE